MTNNTPSTQEIAEPPPIVQAYGFGYRFAESGGPRSWLLDKALWEFVPTIDQETKASKAFSRAWLDGYDAAKAYARMVAETPLDPYEGEPQGDSPLGIEDPTVDQVVAWKTYDGAMPLATVPAWSEKIGPTPAAEARPMPKNAREFGWKAFATGESSSPAEDKAFQSWLLGQSTKNNQGMNRDWVEGWDAAQQELSDFVKACKLTPAAERRSYPWITLSDSPPRVEGTLDDRIAQIEANLERGKYIRADDAYALRLSHQRDQWEYTTLILDGQSDGDDEKTLNRMGREGWELVAVDGTGRSDPLAYFKRRKLSADAPDDPTP